MKSPLLSALLLCAISQPLYALEQGSWLRNGWQPYADSFSNDADDYRQHQEDWERSRLKFSGRTERNSDGFDGSVGLAADRLVGNGDAIGFDYRDSLSYKNDTDSNAASFRYRLPAGDNLVQIEAGRSRYDHAVSNAERRFDASGESRVVGFGVSRPLFSRFGMAFDGLVRHRGRNSVAFEESSLVSESRYQLSTLGLEAHGGHHLGAGLFASTRLLALSGRESQVTDYPAQDSADDEGDFYKVAMSASLEQQALRWNWRLRGQYQFANEDLPGGEYLTVAGPSMLAGFNGQSVAVAQGGWLRLDTASPSWSVPFVQGVSSSVNFAMLQGWIPYSEVQADRHGSASAGQVSLNMQGRTFTADIRVGKMLSTSSMAMTIPDHPDVRFSLSMGI